MRLRLSTLVVCLLAAAIALWGQVGNGTITGTVTDQAGAVVAGAKVDAKNAATGVVYSAASTATGNYTIPDLPVGTYTVTVTVTGFKTYTHSNLAVQAAGTVREDVPLQVGSNTESVTVTAEASLLKTESGELASNVSIEQMDQLPLLGIGTVNSGSSGYRNPYSTLLTLPGVGSFTTSGTFTVNGLGQAFVTTETMRIEGQDATSRIVGNYDYTQIAQPGVDSVQEIAYQTSNYAPEFGQAGSMVINMTMKSGTNQYHGSGYDYFVNEDLNAGDPFSISGCSNNGAVSVAGGNCGKLRPRNRRNDFGGTLGGPIYIPKVYNGHNKSFFFFSYEQYLESVLYTNFTDTAPVPAYLNGDFSAISPNGTCSLCNQYSIPTTPLGGATYRDALGNPMYANEIYDPSTRGVLANGQGFAYPFPNNMIPLSEVGPVYKDFAGLLNNLGVVAKNTNLQNNYPTSAPGHRYSAIPAVKIDHNIDALDKLSFYYSENNTQSQIAEPLGNVDGLPLEIGQYRGTFIPTYTERLNYDRTLSPTLLLHVGAGYLHTSFSDHAPFLSFDPSQFGLSNFEHDRQFPTVTGMCTAPAFGAVGCGAGYGGMQAIGTATQTQSILYEEKPSFNSNLTWVKGKHTFKFGAELYLEQDWSIPYSGVTLTTGTGPTSEPFVPTASFNGYSTGFGFASWMLDDYSSTAQTAQTEIREGSQVWGLFAQDSWKITRKLTVDYGLRWDYDTPERDTYGRLGQFDPTVANANAGGHPGSTVFAANCNCGFYKSAYPYAFGPRLGVAYQITPKTVLRGGWGFVYQFVGSAAGATVSTPGTNSPVGINGTQIVNATQPGFIVLPTWPVLTNVYPQIQNGIATTNGTPTVADSNQNRPPRIDQFSLGIQQEITRSFILEASYVGNRAAWLGGAGVIGGPYGLANQISPEMYAMYGLYPYPGTGPCSGGAAGSVCSNSSYNNYNDYLLLSQTISSSRVTQKMASIGVPNGGYLLPFANASPNTTLMNAIRAFPQYPTLADSTSPTGDSKYNSLQTKATKRFSHGFQATGSFTWQKGFTRATPQDFWNPASSAWDLQNTPFRTLNMSAIYTVPKASFLNKWENMITRDWQLGWYADYQSGLMLTPPSSPTLNFLGAEDTLVAGQPLYTQNINNIHSYNPYYQTVLNPAAWAVCPTNTVCPASGTLYPQFRAPRTPVENANIGRNFRIKERMNFQIRGEFVNIFNRTIMPAPSTSNPQNKVIYGAGGGSILTSGYGVISAYATPNNTAGSGAPYFTGRSGTVIARFSF